MEVILFWIVIWSVLGAVIGNSRGQMASGIVWCLLLGPLGVIIVLLLPNLKQQEKDQMQAKESARQIAFQQAQLAELKRLSGAVVPPPPPGRSALYRIAKDGNDLGEVSLPAIKQMLVTGGLSMNDYYLDAAANAWVPLDQLPGVV